MRYVRITSVMGLTALMLSGCGADTGSGSSSFNPATSVSEEFETFAIDDSSGTSVLSRTLFFDFYQGLEAAEGEDDRDIAEQLRQRLDLLMGLTPGPEGKTYVAARNPFDLLHHLIHTDWIGTFNDGKRLMRDSVTSGGPATYNTPANDAVIRFKEGLTSEDPEPDQLWVYPLLDWTSKFSQFEPVTATIYRSAQFIARPPAEGTSSPAEIKSGFWSGGFKGEDFSATGYNKPQFSALSITGRQFGGVEFYQTFVGSQYDTLLLTDTSGMTIGNDEPVFICAQINYSASEVTVVYETDPDVDTSGTNQDPSQCPDVGNRFTYQTEPVAARQ
jgi:hypothetical protein